MCVNFGQLWFSNVALGILVASIYSLLMFASSSASRDRELDGLRDWLNGLAALTVTVAVAVAFCADVYWIYQVLVK